MQPDIKIQNQKQRTGSVEDPAISANLLKKVKTIHSVYAHRKSDAPLRRENSNRKKKGLFSCCGL